MARREYGPMDCKVYVGELGTSGSKEELENVFAYYGRLKEVWVARNPPGFAFIMFEDPRDARDAVRALDGKLICGRRVKVELSNGKSRQRSGAPPPFVGGYPPLPPPRGDYERGGGRGDYRDYRDPYDSRRWPPPPPPPPRDYRYAHSDRRYDDYPRRRYPRSRSRSPSPLGARTPPPRSLSPRGARYS